MTSYSNRYFATAIFIFIISSQILAQNLQEELNEPITQYKSGDTVFEVCEDIVFQSSSTSWGSDCWGWVDSAGTEYAIYGVGNRVEFYNLKTSSYVGSVLITNTRWHDIKTYQNYCYVVSSDTGQYDGLTIIDMKYLPDSVHLVKRMPLSDGTSEEYPTASHNISIDTVKGYLYSEAYPSENYPFTDVRISNLADPENPEYIRSFGPNFRIHDIFCHNDTLYMAEGENHSFSIWNMANKLEPILLARVSVPNSGYIHNIWPTGDKRHVLTTEETAGKTVKFWNIEDLNNIQLLDEYNVPGGLAHNAHIVGDTAYISCYEAGVIGLDLSNPDSLVELFQYDTYPLSEEPHVAGCWGVYPHTPSGKIYASNILGKLFILKGLSFVLADSLFALNAQTLQGTTVKVDIWAKFTLPIYEFEIPFNWSGPLNLSYDSVSTDGLITDYFELQQLTAYDALNKQGAYLLRSSQDSTSKDLPTGEGVILSIYFTVPDNVNGDSNTISFTSFNGKKPIFRSRCVDYTVDTVSGFVTLNYTCCIGVRGNFDGSFEDPPDINGIDISDLILLVANMFQGGDPSGCPEEADINGSGGDNPIDISDLISLVAFMFQGGEPPADCS